MEDGLSDIQSHVIYCEISVSLLTSIDYWYSIHYQDIFRATIVMVKFYYCSALVNTFVIVIGTLIERLNKHHILIIQMHLCT